ncbi:MAG: serine hydrolase [Cyanobacteria bacterium P01_F01_bin.150]
MTSLTKVGIAQSSGAWIARHGLSSSQYQSEFNTHTENGYRLTHVSGYGVGDEAYYAAIWEKRNGPAYIARHRLSSAQYQRAFTKHTENGYRLTHVSGYSVGNKERYAAIWEKRSGPAYIARHGLSSAQYQRAFTKHTKNGYRLTHVSGYGVGDKERYAAIWEKRSGPAYIARHGLSSAQYQREFNKQTDNGYRLTHVSAYDVDGKDMFAAIWEKSGGNALAARHDMSSKEYQCQFDNFYYQGYRLKLVSGYAKGSSARYAAIWENTGAWQMDDIRHIDTTIKTFMRANGVTGAALAITKDARLVFAKGYGYADKQKGDRACPTTLFLGASMSKPVTSAAILKLVEQGKLKLSDKVFGDGALLGTTYGARAYSRQERAITVQHLLEHTAGGNQWDNNKTPDSDTISDPMFSNRSYDHKELISWVLDNRRVDIEPGSAYHYSNFGYCILGRIIEKVTSQSYEDYVRTAVLKPSGIRDMHIVGRRRWNEVAHDDYSSSLIARMDSHGGWIGSAIDWVRFLVHVDGFDTERDILKPETIETMTTSTLNGRYAKGWNVNASNNWWHGGVLGQSRSILVRTNSGYTWTLLVHGYDGDDSLDSTMWKVINGIESWPSHDLF